MTEINVTALLTNLLLVQPVFVGWRLSLVKVKVAADAAGEYPLSPIAAVAENQKNILNRFEVNFTSASNFPRGEGLTGLTRRGAEGANMLLEWASANPEGAPFITTLTDMKQFFDEAFTYFTENPEA